MHLSVDTIYSIVALRMSAFFSLSNDVLLYNIVCDKEEFVNSSNLQYILFKILRRVYLSSLNIGQRRRKREVDSTSKSRLKIGFKQSWKFCLNLRTILKILLEFDNNPENFAWIWAHAQSCDKSYIIMIITMKNITWGGSNKF